MIDVNVNKNSLINFVNQNKNAKSGKDSSTGTESKRSKERQNNKQRSGKVINLLNVFEYENKVLDIKKDNKAAEV